VTRFVASFNAGNLEELDGIFAPEPDFEWYVTGAPGERLQMGDRESLVLRVRGIERVRVHADLIMLARLALALSRARAVEFAA